ncbi:MAG: DUF4870 domain-containing protein [Planctomycetota bacterium]
MSEHDVRQWTMFIHLSLLAGYVIPFGGLVVPIVLWQMKKDESETVDEHGRMAVNAILSYTCYLVAAGILCLVAIGFVLLPILLVASIAMPIVAGIKANDGVLWRYPLVIDFL